MLDLLVGLGGFWRRFLAGLELLAKPAPTGCYRYLDLDITIGFIFG
jgi:hypothetical protein